MNSKNFITSYGIFCTIVLSVIGVGIFSYPNELANTVGNNEWIVTLVSGFIAYLSSYIIYKSIKINNFDKFHVMMKNNFGKIIGFIFSLVFILYNIVFIAFGMRDFVEVIKMYLLEKTPTEILIIITILTGTYLIRGEIESLIKFNEVAFWIMFIPMCIVLILTINNLNLKNIFPIFSTKPMNYMRAFNSAIYSFSGFTIIYLILPFVKNRTGINKAVFKSMGFITAFYIIITIFCISFFSINQTKILLWPTTTMIQSINIPGAFIERWEGIMMSLWTIFYFTNFINFYFLSSDLVKDVLGLKDIKLAITIVAPIIYIAALYPQNVSELYDLSRFNIIIYNLYSVVILPLILFLVHKFKRNETKEVL